MKPALQLRLTQQLTMTPQLQQAIRLLQLPLIELNTQLQQALADNVMLELEDPGSHDDAQHDVPAEPEHDRDADSPEASVVEGDDASLWNEATGGSGSWSGDESERPETADTSRETLRDHLLWQLAMEDFSPRERIIGEAIVDAINDAGYLVEPLQEILANIALQGGCTLPEVEQTLTKVQALDPPGTGARDLGECLALQLRLLEPGTPGRDLALRIAGSALGMLADHDTATLRRQLGVSEDDLTDALALIRGCHPKPGLAIQPTETQYIIPDVFVRRRDGKWVVDVNRSMAPKLRVNQAYANLVRGDGEHAALRSQLQEARWLVRSLEIRNETLLKVAMCIVERQAAFLEQGEEAMRPMVLRDVADAVGMHESTISRVTASKYMHTPRGVFEFRHFFSSQLSGDDGGTESSTAVRAKIRRLISQEDRSEPLSDSRLADLLAAEGVQVARRTVAKYREALGIEPSSARRQKPARQPRASPGDESTRAGRRE